MTRLVSFLDRFLHSHQPALSGTGTGYVRVEEAVPAELPRWGDEFLGYTLTGRNGGQR